MPPSEGGKEILLTLVAVGLTAPLVASAIVKVLDSLSRNKKYLVSEHVLEPVLDGKGKPVTGSDGRPITYWAEKTRLLEPAQVAQDKSKITAEVRPTMLKFSVSGGG